jgi:putative acyl-CoA dehydrogenase
VDFREHPISDQPRDRDRLRVVERPAICLEASLLVRPSAPAVADAFCASRLDDGDRAFGTLPPGLDTAAIVERNRPQT